MRPGPWSVMPVVSAGQAAARVVGSGSDDTIEAMGASGTNRAGSLVLRIRVTATTPGFAGSTDTVIRTRCYRYTFGAMDQTSVSQADCPATRPLTVLPAPADDSAAQPGG